MRSEQAIQSDILKYLKSVGAYTIKVAAATKSGVPDIICCYKGRFIAIEVKRPETKTNISPLQVANITMIINAQGEALVAWDKEMVKTFIDNIDKEIT
jgi:Holliday junction resolvase